MKMSSKKIIGFLVACIAFIWGASYFHVTHPIEEGKNVFASQVYAEFRKQIQPLNGLNREDHELFIEHLRQNPDQDLIKTLYLKVNLTPAFQTYLYGYVSPPQNEDFSGYVLATLDLLRANPNFNGIHEEPQNLDPLLYGNLPTTLYQWKNTQIIRVPLPLTYSTAWWKSFWQSPKVTPEFLTFLHTQPSHFYINLMRRVGKKEAPLSNALAQLERKEEHLYLITLDKNSSFYNQEGEVPDAADAFKQLFLVKLLDPKGNYYWSRHLNSSWPQELQAILNKTHNTYFDGKKELSKQERLDFIELAYLDIIDALVDKWSPASMNFTCHQAIDRGPAEQVLWLSKHHIGKNDELAALLFAPPLLLHNRSSYPPKVVRMLSAYEHLH